MTAILDKITDSLPLVMLTVVVGGGIMAAAIMFLSELMGKQMRKFESKYNKLPSLEPVARGFTGIDSKVDGIPLKMEVTPVFAQHSTEILSYEACLRYTVANPQGAHLVIHPGGLLNRPLEFLPPAAETIPAWLLDAGFTLRCEPPAALPLVAGSLEALLPFIQAGLQEITLKESELEINLKSKTDWTDDALGRLVSLGAKAARGFC